MRLNQCQIQATFFAVFHRWQTTYIVESQVTPLTMVSDPKDKLLPNWTGANDRRRDVISIF